MTRINLLPWRDELRKERQRQFISVLGLVGMLGVVMVFAFKYSIGLDIENQQRRNNFLQTEINKLESQIKEIEALEKERQQLIDRMDMITNLQQSRPHVVRIFDELVRAIPEGLNLISIERKGDTLTILGTAESSQRVTALMRKIDASPHFVSYNLQGIDTDKGSGAGRKTFSFTVREKTPGEVSKGDS